MPEQVLGRPSEEPSPQRERYAVRVRGLEHLRGPERKIVYHGVNKSGSLTLTKVIREAYLTHHRGRQFSVSFRNSEKDLDPLRERIDHVTGHSFFAGHRLYGSYRSAPGEVLLLTQFRNPLPRARSAYTWLAGRDLHRGRTFEEWLPDSAVTHSQCRQFAVGYAPGVRDRLQGLTTDDLLELALTNVERDVAWFGIAEYFEESAFTVAALCGLPSIVAWATDTRNADRPRVETWDAAQVALVREVYAHDFALYDWALKRFRDQLSSLEIGPDLDRYRRDCLGQYKDRLHPDGSPITRADVDAVYPSAH